MELQIHSHFTDDITKGKKCIAHTDGEILAEQKIHSGFFCVFSSNFFPQCLWSKLGSDMVPSGHILDMPMSFQWDFIPIFSIATLGWYIQSWLRVTQFMHKVNRIEGRRILLLGSQPVSNKQVSEHRYSYWPKITYSWKEFKSIFIAIACLSL